MSYRKHPKRQFNFRQAKRIHARRSPTARHIDEHLDAPMAKSFEQWNAQPNRFDLPNGDFTEPKNLIRDLFF
jgi:hypothetical protein